MLIVLEVEVVDGVYELLVGATYDDAYLGAVYELFLIDGLYDALASTQLKMSRTLKIVILLIIFRTFKIYMLTFLFYDMI